MNALNFNDAPAKGFADLDDSDFDFGLSMGGAAHLPALAENDGLGFEVEFEELYPVDFIIA